MSSTGVPNQSTPTFTNTPTIPQSPPTTAGDGGTAKRGLFGRKKKSNANLRGSPSTSSLASQTGSLLGSGGNGSAESLTGSGEVKKAGAVKSVFGRKTVRVENPSASNSIGSIDELGEAHGGVEGARNVYEENEGSISDDEHE